MNNKLRDERSNAAYTIRGPNRTGEKHEEKADTGKKQKQRRQIRREAAAAQARKKKVRRKDSDRLSSFHITKKAKSTIYAGVKLADSVSVPGEENENSSDVGSDAAGLAFRKTKKVLHKPKASGYGRKIKRSSGKNDDLNVKGRSQKHKVSAGSDAERELNPQSRWIQRSRIKKAYSDRSRKAVCRSGNAVSRTKDAVTHFIKRRAGTKGIVTVLLAAAALLLIFSGMMSSCSILFSGAGGTVIGTSFTADDDEMLAADAAYAELEKSMQDRVQRIESEHPGFDEYKYDCTEISHDPYELAAYLTVRHGAYTFEDVKAELNDIFGRQYQLSVREESEARQKTETRFRLVTVTDPDTGKDVTRKEAYEVTKDYEYRICRVSLINTGIDGAVRNEMSYQEQQYYLTLLRTRGNRDDLFKDTAFAVPQDQYQDYDIPGEALTDARFRNMITEAEKYLGYPYVWGGSSPSSSFDCSGFVSWVVNHCGNGWSVGRQTAEGLKNTCSIIPGSEARPGDLVFFKGTYNTSGASHVGIYVGGGMMIHAGNPISYADIDTPYFQEHFYCFGRLS